MKTRERDEARRLRRDLGLSIKEIERRLGVARSSVSRWVQDIELTEAQHETLRQRNAIYNGQLRGVRVLEVRAREQRLAYQEHGRALARRGDALHAAGTMLYWAEGDKNNKNTVGLTNSDPELLQFFLRFLRVFFPVPDARVRVRCNLFADHARRQREIEQFWLARLELPQTCLNKSAVNVYSKYSQKKRCGRLPYGTCQVRVSNTSIIQSIYGSIQEYGGFERPEWLG